MYFFQLGHCAAALRMSVDCLSLSMVVLNSRNRSEIVWLLEIRALKIKLAIGFIQKTHWNALVRLYK